MSDFFADMVGKSWLNPRERGALAALLPDGGAFLEIGTADGVTVAWLAAQQPKTVFVSVDTFPGPESGVTGALGRIECWRKNAQPNQALWVGTARQLAELYPFGMFDITLVDAEHTYEACLSDLQAAGALTAPLGIIALHDYTRPHNGVRAAFEHWSRGWAVSQVVGSMALLRRSEDKELEDKLRKLGYA